MFGTLGGPELLMIVIVALIVFGPRKLPEIGRSLGSMMAEFRRASNEFKRTLETEVEAEKIKEAVRIDAPASPAPPVTAAEAAIKVAEAPIPAVEPSPLTVSREEPPPPGAQR
jgi:Tat protein translocase TatB subunit